MISKPDKKLLIYEVDPLFFKDANNDGFGDFEGFISKLDYFKYLNIDAVCFPDIFNQEKVIAKPIEESIFTKYGKLNELNQIINWFSSNKIDLLIGVSLKDVSASLLNKTQADLRKRRNLDILVKDTNEQGQHVNWATKKNIRSLENIIDFWTKQKVDNFVLFDFEYIYGKREGMNLLLIEQLKQIYHIIKSINPSATVFLKSNIYNNKIIANIFNNYIGLICDYFIDNSYAFLSTNKYYPYDVLERFSPKQLLQKIQTLKIPQKDNFRYIASFNNQKIGRVLSRWMDEEILHQESTKTLQLLQHFWPYSSINYYGDELGTIRSEVKDINQYYNFSFIEKKRHLESKKISEAKYLESQKYLSKINSQSLFMWNLGTNGGFSMNQSLLRPLPINWKQNNVETQFNDNYSNLNFFVKIINQLKHQNMDDFFKLNPKFKILKKNNNSIVIYKYKLKQQKVMVVMNLTNKFKKVRLNKKYNVIFSSYAHKRYENKIVGLCPYESILITLNI